MLSYMALNNLQDNIQSKSAGMISYRAPSYGQFKTKITPLYWYGVPRNIELGGLTMDVDLMMNYQVEESNDYDKWLAFNQAQGARMSAMEHLVPEQMFSTEEIPANGISAVKALQIAGAEGQRIWTITSENVDIAIPNLNLPDDIISEIRNSAAAGMEITAHELPVNFYGSSQVGYVIIDPSTGAGAYKIGGGENGGEISTGDSLDSILSWVQSVSEDILSEFGDRFTQAFLTIKGAIDRISTAIDLINSCDELGGAAGITSISFVAAGFAGLVLAFSIFPFIALLVAVIGTMAVTALTIRWSQSSRCSGGKGE